MKKLSILLICLLTASLGYGKNLTFSVWEDLIYDDNIYLSNTQEESSVINSTQVGMKYKTAVPNSGLVFNATAFGGYNAYTKENGQNGFWNAFANVDLANDLLNIGNTFVYTSDLANSELTDMVRRFNNNVYLSARTSREKTFGLGFSANDSYDYYYDHPWQTALDLNRINAAVQGFWNISSKTSAFVEYMYSNVNYKYNDEHNSDGSTLALGVEGKIAPKVTGMAKATYAMRDYTHHLSGYSAYEDLFGYDLSLEYRPTGRNVIRLSGVRKFEESTYVNNRYFADTLISLYFSHQLSNRLKAAVTLSYENMDYEHANNQGVKRSDDLYGVRPEVTYQVNKWLSAGAWYQLRSRHSNTYENEYNSNKGGLFLKATL